MSPYELNILLHIYTCPGHFTVDKTNVFNKTIEKFLISEVITDTKDTKNGYKVTEMGEAFIKCILKTEYPELVYVDCLGEIVR